MLWIGSGGHLEAARAEWSPACRVLGTHSVGNAVLAVDDRGVPWMAWVGLRRGATPATIYVGRVFDRCRLTSIDALPGTASEIIEDQPSFVVDGAGFGVVAWRYVTGYGFGKPRGSAAVAWHLGRSPGRRIQLAPEAFREVGTPSVAANLLGITVVAYGEGEFPHDRVTTFTNRLGAIRLRAGRLLGRQRVATIKSGPIAGALGVASGSRGFQLAWRLQPGGSLPSEQIGVETATAGTAGVFSAPQLTPWPAGFARSETFERPVLSDAGGDELAVGFPEESREGVGPVSNLYVTSRRRGEPFGGPQLVGPADSTNPVAAVARRSGAYTIGLQQEGRLLVAAGRFGGHVRPPVVLVRGRATSGLRLAVNARGETFAIWWREDRPDHVLVEAARSIDGVHFGRPRTLLVAPHGARCTPSGLTPEPDGGMLAGVGCTSAGGSPVEYLARYRR